MQIRAAKPESPLSLIMEYTVNLNAKSLAAL
jgi:hypothetical protein